MSNRPLVLGHRGASGYAPENTIEAFKLAAEQGAQGIELDVQMTKDGEIVVIHDEKIDRTANGKGWVKDYTFEELRRFNYNKTHPEYEHADIPTMREVFEVVKPTGMMINIEIKTGVVFYPIEEKMLALTKEMGMEDRVLYSSFNHSTMLRLKELDPSVKVGFLYADGPVNMPEYAKRYGVDAVHPALYNLQYPNFMEDCAANGLQVNTWTINEEEHIRLCVEKGVTSIITNYPDRALAIVNEMCK